MLIRTVFRWDGDLKIYRIFRLIWTCGKGPGFGAPDNYDAELTFALCRPWRYEFRRSYGEWKLLIFGVRFHHEKSFGGRVV